MTAWSSLEWSKLCNYIFEVPLLLSRLRLLEKHEQYQEIVYQLESSFGNINIKIYTEIPFA